MALETKKDISFILKAKMSDTLDNNALLVLGSVSCYLLDSTSLEEDEEGL